LQIAARRLDQVTIFDITGHIDLANSPELRKVLLKELREIKTPRVILNLTGVRYIDSSGVASLVEGLKAARDQGIAFYFVWVEPFGERSVATVAIDQDF
jgi:anti-sigma B factor antagonist